MTNDLQQLEPMLAQQVATTYEKLIGHKPHAVTCHFLSPQEVTIVLDGTITQPERLLLKHDHMELATSMRQQLDEIVRSQLIDTIQALTKQTIVDLLSSTRLESDRTSIIMVFAAPQTAGRSPI